MKPINVTQWINLKGASIKGVFGRRIWETWWKLASLVESGKIDLSDILTHRFELNQSDEAFTELKSGAGKVLFIPKDWKQVISKPALKESVLEICTPSPPVHPAKTPAT